MSKWIDFSKDERLTMSQRVAKSLNIDEIAVEKDWWVTAVLYALFHTNISKYLLFKGGTSLSKCWNIIDRFSEDIDLALNRDFFLYERNLQCANCISNTQIHNLREKGQDYIFSDFKQELELQLSKLGLDTNVLTENELSKENNNIPHDKDPSVLYIQYPSLYKEQTSYTSPIVKIEISVLSMFEPFEEKRISSLIANIFDEVDNDLIQTVRAVSPTRTFLEKAFLLCEEYQRETPRTKRMTRHFYDLEKLMHTPYAQKALNDTDLYYEIVSHRRKFYHISYVDYDKELPNAITIVPKKELLPLYKADYNEMKKSFIYGIALSFEELIIKLQELQDRFHLISQ